MLLALSCNLGSEKTTEEGTKDTVAEMPTTNTIINSNLLLPKEVSTKHIFSDPSKEDIFRLRIDGNNPNDAMVHFTIENEKGELIYAEDFKVGLLFDESMLPENTTLSDSLKIVALKEEINKFFKDENFSTPAIANDSDFRQEYSDKAIWNDIKKDKSAVGFYYLLGGQNGRSIAWSKTKGKVVVYFNCC